MLRDRGCLELLLEDWRRNNYAKRPLPERLERALKPPVVNKSDVTVKEFRDRFEALSQPVIVRGCVETWWARDNWLPEASVHQCASSPSVTKLMCSPLNNITPTIISKLANRIWIERVHESMIYYASHVVIIEVQMKYYAEYCRTQATEDDSPLYIFDEDFGTARQRKEFDRNTQRSLLLDYNVPEFFSDDLFELTGEDRRPPYRWVVIGPRRSGTALHVDPLGTSAWNALIHGRKRWILFPPNTPRERIGCGTSYDSEGVTWFYNQLPLIHEQAAVELGMMDFIQEAGECVYVPGGWWHVVVNLDMSVAVTHNFCSPVNVEQVWLRIRDDRPKLARKFLMELEKSADPEHKQYADRIRALRHVPSLPPESSGSDSSSSSDESELMESETESESDREGLCFCQKCKRKRKREELRLKLGLKKRKFSIYSP